MRPIELGTADATGHSRDFEPDPSTLPELRRFVRSSIEGPGGQDAELIAAELATCLVREGAGPLTVTVRVGERIRLEVLDRSTSCLTLRLATSSDGIGLVVLEDLAGSWGIEMGEEGTVAWAELPRRPD